MSNVCVSSDGLSIENYPLKFDKGKAVRQDCSHLDKWQCTLASSNIPIKLSGESALKSAAAMQSLK